jgi:TonB-linked SusC/RagA family outer membrane protein
MQENAPCKVLSMPGTRPKLTASKRENFTQTLRIMKLIAFFVLAAVVQVSAKGQEKITISVNNAPLEQVFSDIKKQSGYLFVYRPELVANKKISIHISKVTLKEALDHCLKDQHLTYNIVGKSIVIGLDEKQSSTVTLGQIENKPPFIDVHGRVVNEKGTPVEGVTVAVKGTLKKSFTDTNGEFSLTTIDQEAVLLFTHVSMETFELKVSGKTDLVINLKTKISALGDVIVTVNTGYQQISKERATGSFVQINNDLLNRRVSTDILSRLDGIASGVYFNGFANPAFSESQTKLGIDIRGRSTLTPGFVSADPLIVVDGFIYDGEIKNINPNDVEAVTILKDAAAASIWGARSGNGVIVITTKRGKLNQKMKINISSAVTIGNKPDLFYNPSFLNSSDYINAEMLLFKNGFFDFDIQNPQFANGLSPVVEMLARRKLGLISASDSSQIINDLQGRDVRNDYEKYVYQKSIRQQYSVNFSGGSNNLIYKLGIGVDKNRDNLVRNGYNRFSLNFLNTFLPVKNLELTSNIVYTNSNTILNNQELYGSFTTSNYYRMYPYAQLANDNKDYLALNKDYSSAYLDSVERLGFLDWRYRPLDEIALGDNTIKANDMVLRGTAKYNFFKSLSAQFQYQYEKQNVVGNNYQSVETYYVRNLINRFAVRNSNGSFTYPFPVGGILKLNESNLVSNTGRIQIDYNETFGSNHSVSVVGGSEIREIKSRGFGRTSYGYDKEYGTSVTNLNYTSVLPINPNSTAQIPAPEGNITGTNYRYISYYANGSYTYGSKYTVSLSGRRDGANIFGVKTNEKFTPFWSAGIKWDIDNEDFYHFGLIKKLALRATYGFNGNVYNGTAYIKAFYQSSSFTGAVYGYNLSAPNPELKWEKVKNLNVGIDFVSKSNLISGSIEFYQKNGIDLIEPVPLAPSTGFTTFTGNAANTRNRGIDVIINSKNIDKEFKWNSQLIFSIVNSKVLHYDQKYQGINLVNSTVSIEGKPVQGIFSYQWGGLDPNTGSPLGFIGKQTSSNYSSIINNASPDSLVFNGSAVPTKFGSFRNTLSYKNFSVSFNITYKFGYYFRRSSTPVNYLDILATNGHSDYSKRWQNSGDEKITNVPSIVYPSDDNRNNFYKYSETLVERGDHIRLQDISLAYDFGKKQLKKLPFENIQLYIYLNNVGLIWKSNKVNLDPDFVFGYPNPREISFGIRTNL